VTPGLPEPARTASRARPDRQAPGTRIGDYASRVLDVVDAIPPGMVMSYGDVAVYLGEGGPRQVGRVMALWGGSVCWWRVIHADGSLLPGHERAALARYQEEGTPVRRDPGGRPVRVDMTRAGWDGHSCPPEPASGYTDEY
jgi:alkylated DNA nucleotide flippase Atl1